MPLDLDPVAIALCDIPATLAQLAALQTALAARLLTAPVPAGANGHAPELRLLTVDQAAAKLSVTPEWLYRRGKRLGLAVKLGDGTLRFSEAALDAYIAKQTVAVAPTRRRKMS